jgi:hypothetical protein
MVLIATIPNYFLPPTQFPFTALIEKCDSASLYY